MSTKLSSKKSEINNTKLWVYKIIVETDNPFEVEKVLRPFRIKFFRADGYKNLKRAFKEVI